MRANRFDKENCKIESKLLDLMIEHLELEKLFDAEELEQDLVEGWDSSRHLSLIMEIESQFDVAFRIEEIMEMRSFNDIADFLNQKLGTE
jgi:acyl carrier protein